MRIFAYGSNLSEQRLRKRVPSATFVGRAKLEGHRLAFHKRSVDGSGKATVEVADPGSTVWGAVFDCPEEEKPALDEAEGLGNGYNEEVITVELLGGERIEVLAYVADERAKDMALEPYDWYLAYVLDGAREQGLPTGYVEELKRQPSVPDPDVDRAAKNRLVTQGGQDEHGV